MASSGSVPKGVVPKMLPNGKENPKYVDVLEEDKQIAGQKFVCMSFISPEKVIQDKSLFFFRNFLKQWDMNKSLEKFTQFLSFISYKYEVPLLDLSKDLEDFCKEERDNLFQTTLEDEYKTYMDNNEDRLSSEYDETNQFQTSTRGIKIRGSYPTLGEAELRAKVLREVDPNHDVFVGPVGVWVPFHPEAYKTGRVEYLEDELNQLMHEKNKNEARAKQEFDTRVKDTKKKALEENKRKAMETGNMLTQTMDAEGNLVSVKDVPTFGLSTQEMTAEDIHKELFESDNVVIDAKNSDHGLSKLTITEQSTENADGNVDAGQGAGSSGSNA
jgi:hypothetical protein